MSPFHLNLIGLIVSIGRNEIGQFFLDMKKCPMEFGTGGHVHDWIVNTVKNENIPHISPRIKNVIAIIFQPDAPVNCENIARNRNSAQEKRYNIDN